MNVNAILQHLNDAWTPSLLFAACIALPSGVIQGYAGFGGALFATPLFALLFGPVTGFSIIVILMLVSQLQLFSKAVRKADWKEVAPIAGFSAVTMTLGLFFLVSADPSFIRRGMGVLILLLTVFMMFGYRYTGKRRTLVGAATGSVAGAITGSFGVPAFPLSALYFHNSSLSPETIRANVLAALCCTLIVSIIGLSFHGVYNGSSIARAILVGPIFAAGVYLGQYLFRVAPADWFKKVTYAVLIGTALVMLVS